MVYNLFFMNDTEAVHDCHPKTPDHEQLMEMLQLLEEEILDMSVKLDALMAAIADNGSKIDALIAKFGTGGGDVNGATEGELGAAIDAMKVSNDKLDAKLAEPVVVEEPVIGNVEPLPAEAPAPVEGIPGGTNF